MMSRRLFENVKVELTDDSLVSQGERKREDGWAYITEEHFGMARAGKKIVA